MTLAAKIGSLDVQNPLSKPLHIMERQSHTASDPKSTTKTMQQKPKRKLNPKAAALRLKLQKAQCVLLVGFLIPGYYITQLVFVKMCLFNYILSAYFFTNIFGNIYLSIFTDTKVGPYAGEGEYCEVCKQNRPPLSWHCPSCNICIERSDHHCYFLAHCVGRNNYRYFVCFLGHWAFAMFYCSVWYMSQISKMGLEMFLTPLKIIMPIFPPRPQELYVTCLFVDLVFLCFAIGLFGFHARNVYRGTTSYQSFKRLPYLKRHWKTNVVYVLGTRWYWAVLWPFVNSPLPDYELLSTTE